MRTNFIARERTGDSGTFGRFVLDSGTKFVSGELPWRENRKGISCIPPSVYLCQWILSPKHGWCYVVRDVPGRGNIEIHSANWMGDTMLGYKCQLEGCIAPGMAFGQLDGQDAVLDSRNAINAFHEEMKREPFTLIIHGIQEPVASVLGGELD